MERSFTRTPPAERYSEQRLLDNLAVLGRIDPELAERITWPVDDASVLFDELGKLYYQEHRDALCLAVDPQLPEFGSPSLLIVGLGDGDILDLALARESSERITCWERDPWLLRLDLMRQDRRLELSMGRLRYCLGPDLLEHRDWDGALLRHPALAKPYELEWESLRQPKRKKRALLCVGLLFYAQIAKALRAEGFELWSLDIERQAPEELERTVRILEPELILSINYTAGLAEFCAQLETRLVVWEVDPSVSALATCESDTENTWIWTFRPSNVDMYRKAGFKHVAYLALAADPEVRAPLELNEKERKRYGAPISFVGNSIISEVQSLRARFLGEHAIWRGQAGDDGQGAALFERLLIEQRKDFSNYSIAAQLEQAAPGFCASALQSEKHCDPASMAGEFAAAEKRLTYVNHMGRYGMVAWGDKGWAQLAQTGIEFRGSAGHGPELTRIYNASGINLDINRVYQDDIVTMRVFDVLSTGSFVLAEHSEALAQAFEIGQELDSYRTLDELHAKVQHYLAHPEQAHAIAQRGRERVLREHTIARRLRSMLSAAGL